MEKWNRAAYYASGALGALLLAGTMAAAALALVPFLPGGAALAGWPAALHTAGGLLAVWGAAAGAVGLFLVQARLRLEEPEEPEAAPVRRRPAHEKTPKHEKTKATV